jgi:hypothetical protein
MNQNDRDEDIDYWWTGGFVGFFTCRDPLEDRLRHSFHVVLNQIPEEDFDTFMGCDPALICNPGVNGEVGRIWIPVVPGQDHAERVFIYFSENLGCQTDEFLVSLVAHETAHVVLGHFDHSHYGGYDDEKSADALVMKWGFKPSYSEREFKRMKARRDKSQNVT